jgi:hypothetical protein
MESLPIQLESSWRPYTSTASHASSQDEDWTLELLDERMAAVCHRSATEHRDFIREEMADFVESGFYAVLPYSAVRHLPGLRLSPWGWEERDRRARLVVDHTWFLINQHTLEDHQEAMQFGGALTTASSQDLPRRPCGPVYLAKYDIKDGFYRMMIRRAMHWPLTVILPNMMGKNKWWRSPRTDMGWINSPQLSAMSETACDIANARLYRRHSPPHRWNAWRQPMTPSYSDLPPILDGPFIRRRGIGRRPTRTGTARTGQLHDDLASARSERPAVADASTGAPSTGQRERTPPLSSDDPDDDITGLHPVESRAPAPRRTTASPSRQHSSTSSSTTSSPSPRNQHRLRTVRTLMHAIDEVLKAPVISRQIQGALSLSKLVKDGSWTSTQSFWVGSWTPSARPSSCHPTGRATPGCLQEPQGSSQQEILAEPPR